MIFKYFYIKIESNLWNGNEQTALMELLNDKLKRQKGHENLNYIVTDLLYRGAEHEFDTEIFHDMCDNEGPTITVIHNEYDHIFGGYVSKSWNCDKGEIEDRAAFLWVVRPHSNCYDFETAKGNTGPCNSQRFGPMFGKGADIWISSSPCNANSAPLNGCGPVSFKFDVKEISGNDPVHGDTYTSWNIKDYEVFSVSMH